MTNAICKNSSHNMCIGLILDTKCLNFFIIIIALYKNDGKRKKAVENYFQLLIFSFLNVK